MKDTTHAHIANQLSNDIALALKEGTQEGFRATQSLSCSGTGSRAWVGNQWVDGIDEATGRISVSTEI